MKIKKFLEKVAEEDRESLINDKDIEFLASIGVDYNKKRDAAKEEQDSSYYRTKSADNRKALIISVACSIVALFAVILILIYSLKPAPFEPPIEYFEDNFIEAESSLQELNGDLQSFSLIVNTDVYRVKTTRVYDSLSEDNLYYKLELTTYQVPTKILSFDIVVNSNYHHEEIRYTSELIETQISEYTVKYTEESVVLELPFSNVNCMGEMQIGNQWIYIINYEEMALGQSTFIETLQSLIVFN